MGSGSWKDEIFTSYSTTKGLTRGIDGSVDIKNCSAQSIYKSRDLDPALDPKGVIRECVDSEEHPNTVPVILALDVTGSMGATAVEVASELGNIMTDLYKDVTDVEFMIMGIGDFAYDDAPLQVSQFESDIRIAEQLDKIYFEGGGGGNSFESYTAAWAFGVDQCKLDCWKRGKKGIIITMGDENLNPYIGVDRYKHVTDFKYQAIETPELFDRAKEKYDIFHINVIHDSWGCRRVDRSTWTSILGEDNYFSCEVKGLAQKISSIIKGCVANNNIAVPVNCAEGVKIDENGAITW